MIPSSTNRPFKILVVDDEPDVEPMIRQKFRRRVRKGELELVFAHDGIDALEKLEADPEIGAVLTDLNMPRMDGLTLLARLEEQERILMSVVLTAYGDMKNIRFAMNRGAFDFLTKPIDLDDLEITLNKTIASVADQRRAALVRMAFGRYLSDEIVSMLLDRPDALQLGGEKRCVTILMSDLRGFSTLSERHPPERVVEILNIYLGRMAEVISEYQGIIDEFIGDAILVFFGAPFQGTDDPHRAVACALAMQQAMTEVNAELVERGLPHLEMGIGINTGDVVVGNIGAPTRTKYGAVGSHVNLTGRIESYTVGGQVLISANTLAEVEDAVEIGQTLQLSAKGFSAPILVYEVEAIGAPYNLRLPHSDDQLVPLAEPWPLEFSLLDGKYVNNTSATGTLSALSATGALLCTDEPLEALTNLVLSLAPPEDSEVAPGELYAKVVEEIREGELCYRLRFTAVPAEVAEAIARRFSAER